MWYRLLLAVWLMGMGGPLARAQDAYVDLARQMDGPRIYHEAVTLPGRASPVLAVLFRIPNRALVFVRDPRAETGDGFVADAVVTVEIYKEEQRVAEQVWHRRHRAGSFDETQRRDVDLKGLVSFDLPPGRYGYRVIVEDEHTARERPTALRPVSVHDYRALTTGQPLVVQSLATGPDQVRLEPVNLSAQVPYARPSQVLLPVGIPDTTDRNQIRLHYTVRRLDPEMVAAAERAWQRQVEIALRADHDEALGTRPPVEEEMPVPAGGTEIARDTLWGRDLLALPAARAGTLSPTGWTWPAPADTALGYFALLDLAPENWLQGSYGVAWTLTAGAHQVNGEALLRTHWRDQPLSLRDPEVAIRNLEFLEDRKTVRVLLKGSRWEQAQQLNAYWKPRDPTPRTEYNELMVEYYHRIDVAAEAFRTGTVPGPDGLRTDRARIYVLYGPPDEIGRTFPPRGGVDETWIYADGRQFVFHAPTSLDPFELRTTGSQ